MKAIYLLTYVTDAYVIPADRYLVLDNGTLIVGKVTTRDAGAYRCVGVNDASAQTFAAQLTIAS